MVDISEKSLEQTIEVTLLAGGRTLTPEGERLAVVTGILAGENAHTT